jgi:hypothetical protein
MIPVLNVFISYSHRDLVLVNAIKEQIEKLGSTQGREAKLVNVWFDKKSIDLAATWREEIKRGLSTSAVVCLFVTTASMTSPYVRDEVELAWQLHVRVVPILCQEVLENELNEEQLEFYRKILDIQLLKLTDSSDPLSSKELASLDRFLKEAWYKEADQFLASGDERLLLGKLLKTRHDWAVCYFDRRARILLREANTPVAQYYVYALRSIPTPCAEEVLKKLADWWRREFPPALTVLLEIALENPVDPRYWNGL